MSPECEAQRGGRQRGEKEESEREEALSAVGSRNRLVARKMREGIERASGCIRFRGARSSGPEADFDHVNDQIRGPEGE